MRRTEQIRRTAALIAQTRQTIPYPIGPLKEAEAIAVEVKTLLPEYCVSVIRKRDIAFPYQIKLENPEAANKAIERPLARNPL